MLHDSSRISYYSIECVNKLFPGHECILLTVGVNNCHFCQLGMEMENIKTVYGKYQTWLSCESSILI